MKNIFIAICILSAFAFSCKEQSKEIVTPDLIEIPASANGSAKNNDMPVMSFEKDVHDFGRLSEGERITYSFKFTNTGKSDLIISQISSGCGCTIADFPKGRIKKGELGYITVTFNSSGKHGQQNQVVTVMANTQPSTNRLTIRAQVVSVN